MNEVIERIFKNFEVDDKVIPVSFVKYDGKLTTYITYQQTDADNSFSGDDKLLGYVDYYDFDVFSKGNYFNIIEKVKELLEAHGFTWQPNRSSGDLFEDETGYFHKTLSFAIEREV